MKASFVAHLKSKYPNLTEEALNTAIADQLLSPYQLHLSSQQIDLLKNEVNAYWNLRQWGTQELTRQYEQKGLRKPDNYSACMSYDFHINQDGLPELIEINTNASFLALGLELYDFLKIPNVPGHFDTDSIVNMFKEEARLGGKSLNQIAIVDDKPSEQRLYVEFLLYNEIFNSRGIKSEILDSSQLTSNDKDLIYNRHTDFYFDKPENKNLRDLFNGGLNFSPNPYEYFLLADKQRLLDWNKQNDLPRPASLLPAFDLGQANKDEIWAQRKGLFIKPKNSFGSKQAYKAASISHKVFDEIFNDNFIAQKLSTASEIDVIFQNQVHKLKYDLRCFAYKNELQLIIARLYQGQTTNLRTPGGGFAAVKIN